MDRNNKLFRVLDEYIYFDSAQESQEYAKNNPGKIVTRNSNPTEPIINKKPVLKDLKLDKTPNKILQHLNQYVIAQNEAKKDIALAMYYHSLKSKYSSNKEIGTNGPVMLVGPTGSGKTFIIQKACEYIDTTFVHVDTSSIVPEGIIGFTIGDLAKSILKEAYYDMSRAEKSVVFFDEVDKLYTSDRSSSNYGEKVSNQLLRLLEGTKIRITDKLTLDTSKIQFILGGAFQWILDRKREDDNPKITLDDLYEESIPKELLGRMNTIVNLSRLSEDDYFNILKNSKSSPLQELINKVEFHGDKVEISDETLHQVANIAAQSELGVRAVKQTLKNMFSDALFDTADGTYKTHRISYKESYGSLRELLL